MVTSVNETAQLYKKSERFKQLFNNSGVGIFIVDKDRIIIESNATCCKIFGYTYEELIHQSALTMHLSYASYVNFANIAFNKVRQNEALNLEYPFRHKEGHAIWLRIAGDSIPSNEEVLWTITDITSRREAQEQLKDSMALLRDAEAIAHFGSWEILLNENNTMKWSEEMYRIYGEEPNTFRPSLKKLEQFLSEEDIERMRKINRKALQSGVDEELAYEIVRKNGTRVYIHTHRKAIYNDNGVPIKLVGTTLDITKQKENELKIQYLNESLSLEVALQLEKLREKDKQLQYQSRLAQMGETLSMIAHQWRQPLAAISATTSFLLAKLMLEQVHPNEFKEEIEHIESYSAHLSHTIDDFKNFFKATKQKELTSLERIVKKTLAIVSPVLNNRNILITTEFLCHKELVTFENELGQALLNIIKNAEDALIEHHIIEPFISIKTYASDTHAYLVVEDNAGGIAECVMPKIFEPYFSTKLHKDGSGIGLCMSKTIVEEHCGGHLYAKNSAKGARFTFSLPLS
ncbi:MAG: PAS domain S-box protein [Sulfurospirillaceae bacterium]|nr:PAS domain S-box protein [Sulfurospirillaceae bacterium]MDD2827000.1 PAS domain S-box protein [Sulfurospirillaceae bacterium]